MDHSSLPNQQLAPENAYFEHIMVPPDESFLWRKDDYPWEKNKWNFHPELEIHLVRKSEGLCYAGDYIGHFEPGHLSIIGSNLPHDWITLPSQNSLIKGRDIVVQFMPDPLLTIADKLPELKELINFFDRANLGIEFIGKTAMQGAQLLEKMGQVTGLERFALFIQLLSLLSKSTETNSLATNQFVSNFRPGNSEEREKLKVALNFVQDNYLSNPKLSEVAKLTEMSETTFSRFFKAQTGNTYSSHINIMRIWMAQNLLRNSDLSVTDICFEAGFSNISNFNRSFLKQTGMKPLQYRKAIRMLDSKE